MERQPWPSVGEGGMETERGSSACLLSENTEKYLSGFLQRLPSVARPLVSRSQALDGSTPSLPMGRLVAGFC